MPTPGTSLEIAASKIAVKTDPDPYVIGFVLEDDFKVNDNKGRSHFFLDATAAVRDSVSHTYIPPFFKKLMVYSRTSAGNRKLPTAGLDMNVPNEKH
jgi:hypothetical protein